ncbi:MAG: site-2 protease family protein, partial [Dolichospermum sp.]
MLTSSETPIIAAIVLIASGILGWGFYRARPFGKLGILAWLQSVVLMTPWLLFFGLFALGIYVNIVGILFSVIVSAGLYIFLGRKLRQAGQDAILKQRATERLAAQSSSEPDKNSPAVVELQSKPTSIPEADLSLIRGIFGIDTFFATETIPYQEGVVFKGNLRGEPEAVHNRLTKSLQERLNDKYRLFLVENTDGKPVIIVLPSRTDPQRTQLGQKVFAVILLIATMATSLEVGGILQNFDLLSNPERFPEALPIALGLFIIFISHEVGHWLLARRHQVRLSWPFFLPAVQVGSFGAITRFESLVPNR